MNTSANQFSCQIMLKLLILALTYWQKQKTSFSLKLARPPVQKNNFSQLGKPFLSDKPCLLLQTIRKQLHTP